MGLIPRSGRFPGEGNDSPFQYSCLEKPVDRGAWWATVHGIARVGHDLAAKPPPQEGKRDQVLQRLPRPCPGNEETRGPTVAFLQCSGDGCHLVPGPAPGADLPVCVLWSELAGFQADLPPTLSILEARKGRGTEQPRTQVTKPSSRDPGHS